MSIPVDVLTDLARGLQIDRSGPAEVAPGQLVGVKLLPPASDLRVTDVVSGALDLTFITKNVRFEEAALQSALDGSLNDDILGGIPLAGLNPLPGVPGILGQLAGSLPIPVELPVRIEVHWSVRDEEGAELDEGSSFLAPDGLDAAEVSFLFAPQIVELTSADAVPPPVRRFIHASVRLSAGGTSTPFLDDLPDLPVLIPALPIPTVLALFLHDNFEARQGDDDGAALIVVPADSPIRSLEQLQPILDTLESVVSTLSAFTGFVAFLLGIRDLVAALPPQPHVQFRANDQISNLNDITLIQRGLLANDTEAEDELSSLIFVGPPGRSVQCFNARNFDDDEGQFDVTIGPSFFTIVRDLHSETPATEPQGDEGEVVAPPDGTRPGTITDPVHQIETFGDEFSSLRFA